MAQIDETNFQKTAQNAIKKYEEMGMFVDAMFWQAIIGFYEKRLGQVDKALGTSLRAPKTHRVSK